MHKQLEKRKSLGLFGGTFDPIHFGHLRAALEIYQNLKLDEMRIIPCKQPPHRPIPKAAPLDRIEMVRNAVINTPLMLDDREMHRDGPSYTVDTLMSFRREFPRASLCLLVGVDTFLGLTSWHQWEKIIQLANIMVMHRHGWTVPDTGIIAELLQTYAPEND
jgi:nicotinate-nucleotide adenylyltransferase